MTAMPVRRPAGPRPARAIVAVLAALAALLLAAPAVLRAQGEPVPDSLPDSLAFPAPDPSERDGAGDGPGGGDDDGPGAERLRLAAAFFADRSPLALRLASNYRALRRQRGDENPWREAELTIVREGEMPAPRRARLRTRGVFRLRTCEFPPLRLRIGREAREGTVLEGLRRPKLVTHCQDRDEFEQFLLQEYLAYRIYEALTPMSLRARLVRVAYVDSASGRPLTERAAIVLEEEGLLAARLGGEIFDLPGAKPHNLDARQSTLMAVFQLLIGNTDWWVGGLHNIVLVKTPAGIYPVPYDFDHAGLVNPPYAAPHPSIGIRKVTERRYRGTCATIGEIQPALDLLQARRDEIYALLDDPEGLWPRTASRMRWFLDEFYEMVRDPERVRREIVGRCLQVN